jgi:PAS domain S-box-containing protein
MSLPSVVVVDDAPEVRALIRRALELSRRVTVVGEAGDGAAAVDLAGSLQPELMLLDVSMPDMDGLEALPRIREASPETRVVMYTGFDEQGLADRARALGAAGYVEKSAPISAVVMALLAALPRSVAAGAEPPTDKVAELEVAPLDRTVLAEHLERFREVFEEATIGMATMTLNGHLVRANRALAELLGRPVHQLVGIRYETLTEDQDVLRRPLQILRTGQKVVQFEHAVPGADLRVLVTLATVRDSRARPLYIFLQMQDVTAQRRATEALRQSEERFRLLVEAVQDYAIFMLTTEGIIASWNAGAQRIKGYTAEEIVGRHFRTFYPPDKQSSRHPEHELELALRDGRYEEEGWRIRKDGSKFWANVVITAVHDGAGVHIGFAKVTRDMTERQEMLDHLESMNSRLAQAAQEQAEFLAVTAHELRTPVGVLSGAAGLLATHWPDLGAAERAELFESMASSSTRLRRLLEDLLTASRLESGTIEFRMNPTPVDALLSAAVTRALGSDPDAQILLTSPPDLLVEVDPDRLAQAVDNLISNALRHGSPPVQVTAVDAGPRVEIRVADAGTGPPARLQSHLFQRFTTGAHRGTGLGLFIVRELARAHGGDASYELPTPARPGGAFVISLPRATAATGPTEPALRLAATHRPSV